MYNGLLLKTRTRSQYVASKNLWHELNDDHDSRRLDILSSVGTNALSVVYSLKPGRSFDCFVGHVSLESYDYIEKIKQVPLSVTSSFPAGFSGSLG